MAKQQRTDAHRPGAIIPAHYIDWNSYSLARNMIPAIGVDCAQPYFTYDHEGRVTGTVKPTCNDTGRCCVASTERHAERDGREIFGCAGRCGVCGAHFSYGVMFKHEPTGAIVHMGHDCADKYGAMYDLSAWALANDRAAAAVAKAIARDKNETERAKFLDANPGLAEALKLGDTMSINKGARILADLAMKFTMYRSMSPKQVAFAMKLANEITNPAPAKVEEAKVAAPTGKGVEFEGEIVSAKIHEGEWGSAWKVTVKVNTPDGIWLAWGTCDRYILDLVTGGSFNVDIRAQLIGLRVAVKATLEASKGSERICEYCGGSGTETEGDYARTDSKTGRQYAAVTRTVKCGGCNGVGRVGRAADSSFAFMKRPNMTLAGVYNHPVRKVVRAKKAKAAPEVTE